MADTRSETSSNIFSNCSGKVIECVCEKCHDFEMQLKNVWDTAGLRNDSLSKAHMMLFI